MLDLRIGKKKQKNVMMMVLTKGVWLVVPLVLKLDPMYVQWDSSMDDIYVQWV